MLWAFGRASFHALNSSRGTSSPARCCSGLDPSRKASRKFAVFRRAEVSGRFQNVCLVIDSGILHRSARGCTNFCTSMSFCDSCQRNEKNPTASRKEERAAQPTAAQRTTSCMPEPVISVVLLSFVSARQAVRGQPDSLLYRNRGFLNGAY